MAAPNAPTGVYRFNVADHVRAAQLLLILLEKLQPLQPGVFVNLTGDEKAVIMTSGNLH